MGQVRESSVAPWERPVRLQTVRFCGNKVTPTELQNSHARLIYRQVIPTGLPACNSRSGIHQTESD
jgi:hypothetical protein